jgi:hypothetical protein
MKLPERLFILPDNTTILINPTKSKDGKTGIHFTATNDIGSIAFTLPLGRLVEFLLAVNEAARLAK